LKCRLIAGFEPSTEDHPEILAHQLFVERVPDVGRNGRDGGDQFGSTLPDALFINAGTGLQFGRRPAPSAYLPPTRTFSEDRLELTIAGVRLQLLHTPFLQVLPGSLCDSRRTPASDRPVDREPRPDDRPRCRFPGAGAHAACARARQLPEKDRAARVIELAGGRAQVLSRARRALADKDFQWAAELTDYVLAMDEGNVEAKRLKAAALSELGERQMSAIARNYYLSAAQYLLRDLPAR
jgi:alkyl sulfatase BDS1-like metallo-beta-lactamase superfamily hydrolase